MSLEVQELMACLRLVRWHGASLAQKSHVVSEIGSYQQAISLSKLAWEELLNKKVVANMPDQQDIADDMEWLSHALSLIHI